MGCPSLLRAVRFHFEVRRCVVPISARQVEVHVQFETLYRLDDIVGLALETVYLGAEGTEPRTPPLRDQGKTFADKLW